MRAPPSLLKPTVLFPSAEFYRGTVHPHALSPNWITALYREINPHNYIPPQTILENTLSHWRTALRTFLLADLRAGFCGKRVHTWKGTDCVIAYYLHPMPAFLDILGLYGVRDRDIDDEVLQMIEGFALCATWIYSPPLPPPRSTASSFSWLGCASLRHKHNRSHKDSYEIEEVSLSSLPSHSSQESFFLPIFSHGSSSSSTSSIPSSDDAASPVRQPTGIPMDSGEYIILDDGNPVQEEEDAVMESLSKELYSWDWRSERVSMRLTLSVDDEVASDTESVSGVHDDPASEHEVVVTGIVP